MSTVSSHHRRPGGWATGGPTFDLGRILLGGVVITLGVLVLLDAAGQIDAGKAISNWWPVVVIAIGALQLVERRRSSTGPLILIAIGVVLLLFATDAVSENGRDYVWAIVLILAGLLIIAHWRGRPVPLGTEPSEVVRATGVFGGPKVASSSQSFRGASLTAIFGGVTLDLRSARPAPGGAAVNATAVLGGIEVLVPEGWQVEVSGTPILGGIEDKTDHSHPAQPDAPRLEVDALSVLGGVEVKHKK
jgi:predicted membrane protein